MQDEKFDHPERSSTNELIVAMLALAGTLAGCETSYRPVLSPRIATVMEGGSPAYLRDGVTIDSGPFGTGLVEAVERVPEARDHAETFRDLSIGGFVLSLVGAGAAGGAIGWLAAAGSNDDEQIAPLVMSVSGLAVTIVGLSLLIAAQPHQFDAINLYNDAVTAPGPMWPAPPAQTWGPMPGPVQPYPPAPQQPVPMQPGPPTQPSPPTPPATR